MLLSEEISVFLNSLYYVSRPLPETTLCGVTRIHGRYSPVFFIVENREAEGNLPAQISYIVSAVTDRNVIVPFFLFRVGEAIYDWWFIWQDRESEILLDSLIDSGDAYIFFLWSARQILTSYRVDNNWSDIFSRVKREIEEKRLRINGMASVKLRVIEQFRSKDRFWEACLNRQFQ